MTVAERIRASIERHPGSPDWRIASNIRGATAAMVRVARGHKAAQVPTGLRRLAEFRKTHDVRLMIGEGIKRHLKGDSYCTDQEFRELCGVHVANWRRYAELEEFARFRVAIKGVHYWASPGTIEAMKEIVGMI